MINFTEEAINMARESYPVLADFTYDQIVSEMILIRANGGLYWDKVALKTYMFKTSRIGQSFALNRPDRAKLFPALCAVDEIRTEMITDHKRMRSDNVELKRAEDQVMGDVVVL